LVNNFDNHQKNSSGEGQETSFLEEIDLEKILLLLKKNAIWMILIFFLSILISFLYLRYTPSVYKSESVLKLNEKKEAQLFNVNRNTEGEFESLSGEIELLKSNLLLKKVVSTLDFEVSYFAYGNILNTERFPNFPFIVQYDLKNPALYNNKFDLEILDANSFELVCPEGFKAFNGIYKFGQPIQNAEFSFLITADKKPEKGSFYFIINSESALMSYISSNMNAEILNAYAHTIKVSFQNHNRHKAQKIVSAIDSVYLVLTLQEKNKANKQKISFLDSQLATTEKKLEQYESYFEEFIIRNKTNDIPSYINKSVEAIELISETKKGLNQQLKAINELYNQLLSDSIVNISVPIIENFKDDRLFELFESLNTVQLQRKQLLGSYNENTFAVKSKNQQLEDLREKILSRLDEQKSYIFEKARELNEGLAKLENQFLTLPSKGTEYTKHRRFYTVFENFYIAMMQRKAEYGIAEAGTIPEFVVLSPASFPANAIFPNKFYVYGLGAAIGLFLSLSVLAVAYLMHNKINHVKELERYTGIPILGVIPFFNKEKLTFTRLIVDKNPKSVLSEALRSIRTNMEFIVPNKKKKIISITSTVSGEGKTFVAVNLGGVIALSQLKVVIVDLDMRKPKINLAFGEENLQGVSTVLIGKHTVEECIRKTTIKNLDYISAGPTPPNPSELILTEEFDQFLAYLHQIYDIIILDTPPVGLVTDGVLIMRKADLPIYIFRADYSRKEFTNNLNRLIRENKFNKVSLILNSVKLSANNYAYYGYGSEYYEESDYSTGKLTKIKEMFSK
jgi:tyrosine-protein kinase Etk/Wzc